MINFYPLVSTMTHFYLPVTLHLRSTYSRLAVNGGIAETLEIMVRKEDSRLRGNCLMWRENL